MKKISLIANEHQLKLILEGLRLLWKEDYSPQKKTDVADLGTKIKLFLKENSNNGKVVEEHECNGHSREIARLYGMGSERSLEHNE